MLKNLRMVASTLPILIAMVGGSAHAASIEAPDGSGGCMSVEFQHWPWFDTLDDFLVPYMEDGTGTSIISTETWFTGGQEYTKSGESLYFSCSNGVISVDAPPYGSYNWYWL